jgi:GNAT superfamily N-acetyltransferase
MPLPLELSESAHTMMKETLMSAYGVSVQFSDMKDVEQNYRAAGGEFWVAIKEGTILGTIALLDVGLGRGYLKRMYVHKNWQRKGIGSSLLRTLVQFAAENGMGAIYLGTIEGSPSEGFFRASGFVRTALPDDLDTYGDKVFFKLLISK